MLFSADTRELARVLFLGLAQLFSLNFFNLCVSRSLGAAALVDPSILPVSAKPAGTIVLLKKQKRKSCL